MHELQKMLLVIVTELNILQKQVLIIVWKLPLFQRRQLPQCQRKCRCQWQRKSECKCECKSQCKSKIQSKGQSKCQCLRQCLSQCVTTRRRRKQGYRGASLRAFHLQLWRVWRHKMLHHCHSAQSSGPLDPAGVLWSLPSAKVFYCLFLSLFVVILSL